MLQAEIEIRLTLRQPDKDPTQAREFNIYVLTSLCLHFTIYIYIYIVIHRQTVSFYQNSSVWLDTQDARSRDRNPSNFMLD